MKNLRFCGSALNLGYSMVQIWLLSATLESFLAGHRVGVVRAAIILGLLFLACLGLYLFVDRVDSKARQG